MTFPVRRARICTHSRGFWRDLFISFKLIHRRTVQALSGHRPPTMATSLENLSTAAVIDRQQNSADDGSPLKAAVGIVLA